MTSKADEKKQDVIVEAKPVVSAGQAVIDKHQEEATAAIAENEEKASNDRAKEFSKTNKERAEAYAKKQSKTAEPVKLRVKNPLSVAQERNVAGMTIYIPAGTSDVYAPAGVDEILLRRAIGKLAPMGVTIEEDEKPKSKAKDDSPKAAGAAGGDNEGIEFEPTEEEIDQFVKGAGAPLPTGFTQPFREPGQNGTKTDAELEDQKREWARTELKRTAVLRGQAQEGSRKGAARRIAEEK